MLYVLVRDKRFCAGSYSIDPRGLPISYKKSTIRECTACNCTNSRETITANYNEIAQRNYALLCRYFLFRSRISFA